MNNQEEVEENNRLPLSDEDMLLQNQNQLTAEIDYILRQNHRIGVIPSIGFQSAEMGPYGNGRINSQEQLKGTPSGANPESVFQQGNPHGTQIDQIGSVTQLHQDDDLRILNQHHM